MILYSLIIYVAWLNVWCSIIYTWYQNNYSFSDSGNLFEKNGSFVIGIYLLCLLDIIYCTSFSIVGALGLNSLRAATVYFGMYVIPEVHKHWLIQTIFMLYCIIEMTRCLHACIVIGYSFFDIYQMPRWVVACRYDICIPLIFITWGIELYMFYIGWDYIKPIEGTYWTWIFGSQSTYASYIFNIVFMIGAYLILAPMIIKDLLIHRNYELVGEDPAAAAEAAKAKKDN